MMFEVHEMQYNTARKRLYVREYGRHIHLMVEKLCEIKDEEERLASAYKLISILKSINPQYKAYENSDQKIWDMLYYISNFKLNVNGPYPPPPKDNFLFQPIKMPYNTKISKRYHHLGKHLLALIHIAKETEDKETLDYMTRIIVHYMRLSYATWHNELPNDESIKAEVRDISQGKLVYDTNSSSAVNKKYYQLMKVNPPPSNNNKGKSSSKKR